MAESIALVLAGGGARGAYEVGVLSVLLPWLEEEHGCRPDLIVGTSVGALTGTYIAAHADEPTRRLIEQGCEAWETIRYRDVLEPLLSLDEVTTLGRLAMGLAVRGVIPYRLLDPTPFAETLKAPVDFRAVHENITDPRVAFRVCAVVATAAHSNRSVVFHDGGHHPPSDNVVGSITPRPS